MRNSPDTWLRANRVFDPIVEQADFEAAQTAHMRLMYLAPGIVRDLVEGRQSEGLTPGRLLSLAKDLPHDGQLQRAALGLETR